MTQKIVINTCHGGFGLSKEASDLYCAFAGITEKDRATFYDSDLERDDPVLIQVLERLGANECSDRFAALRIVEVPDGVKWTIEDFDGKEWVAEAHRTWR